MTKAVDRLGEAPSNMQAFLCHQSVQTPRIKTEFRPFAVILLTELDILCHQSKKEGSAS
jgi:hypothetical protein